MAFDNSKNEIIREQEVPVDKGKIVVGIYNYNKGEAKFGQSRIVTGQDGTKMRVKLGRKTLKEMEATMPIIMDMIEVMKEAQKQRPFIAKCVTFLPMR